MAAIGAHLASSGGSGTHDSGACKACLLVQTDEEVLKLTAEAAWRPPSAPKPRLVVGAPGAPKVYTA